MGFCHIIQSTAIAAAALKKNKFRGRAVEIAMCSRTISILCLNLARLIYCMCFWIRFFHDKKFHDCLKFAANGPRKDIFFFRQPMYRLLIIFWWSQFNEIFYTASSHQCLEIFSDLIRNSNSFEHSFWIWKKQN